MSAKTKVGLGGETALDAPGSPRGGSVAEGRRGSIDAADPIGETAIAGSLGSAPRHSAPLVGSAAGGGEGEPQRGDTIGRFVVLGVLGAGGMGLVYSGYDPHLDRKVAIKLLRGAAVRDHAVEARTRLLREAQAMAKINHPNVIRVHEVGTFQEQVYLAMEFADAGTLRDWLKAEPRSQHALVEVFSAAGRGLAAAHAAGLVHRDFKPDNVLMSKDGAVRVTDFGLVSTLDSAGEAAPVQPARAPEADDGRGLSPDGSAPEGRRGSDELSTSASTPLSQDLTRTGAIMGTPTYMAPEQFAGETTTARTDQFAFCIALYEALYGQRPFAGEGYVELSTRVLVGDISPPPKGSRVPSWLRRVLLRGLAVAPAARYPTMTELLAALTRDRVRRRRRTLLAGGLVACAAAGVAAYGFWPAPADVCGGGDARFAAIWNADRAATMTSAFSASKRPLAAASLATVTARLDRWGEGWRYGYVEACRETHVQHTQSEHLLDVRMQCLGRRLDDTSATIDALVVGGDDTIDHAVNAVVSLPSVAPCADAAALIAEVAPPDNLAIAGNVAAIRAQLDAARGLERLARYADAMAIAQPALVGARASKYQPVIAEALYLVGSLQRDRRVIAETTTLDDAMHTAAAAGDATVELDAAAELVLALAVDTPRLDVARELGTFAEAIAQHAHVPIETTVRLEDSIGFALDARGEPADARSHLELALALTDKLDPDNPVTITTLDRLGNLDRHDARFADAHAMLARVLASRERVFGKDHPAVAETLVSLGRVEVDEGKVADAKALYERALAIRTAALGPAAPDVAESLNALGEYNAAQGDNVTAQRDYEQALAILQKAFGVDALDAEHVESNLGVSQLDQGNYPDAQRHLEHARAVVEAALGPEHPTIAAVLTNLGVVAKETHRLDDAVALYQRAEKIDERVHGPDHPDVAADMANVATVLKLQHKLDEAETLTVRALHITEKAFGAEHPRVGMSLTNLGALQVERDEDEAAMASFARALVIFEAALGKDHPYDTYPLRGMAEILLDKKRAAEALPLAERALAIRIAAKLPSSFIGETRFILARSLYADPRQHARALAEARTALAEYQDGGSPDDITEVKDWLRVHK